MLSNPHGNGNNDSTSTSTLNAPTIAPAMVVVIVLVPTPSPSLVIRRMHSLRMLAVAWLLVVVQLVLRTVRLGS